PSQPMERVHVNTAGNVSQNTLAATQDLSHGGPAERQKQHPILCGTCRRDCVSSQQVYTCSSRGRGSLAGAGTAENQQRGCCTFTNCPLLWDRTKPELGRHAVSVTGPVAVPLASLTAVSKKAVATAGSRVPPGSKSMY